MKKNDVNPNLETFNSILFSITRMSKSPAAFDYMNQVFLGHISISYSLNIFYSI